MPVNPMPSDFLSTNAELWTKSCPEIVTVSPPRRRPEVVETESELVSGTEEFERRSGSAFRSFERQDDARRMREKGNDKLKQETSFESLYELKKNESIFKDRIEQLSLILKAKTDSR